MAVKKEELEAESAAARRRPIEVFTENGFSIVRANELQGRSVATSGQYLFVVTDSNFEELEINVEIDVAAVSDIFRASKGRITSDSSYWIACAERHLADYLGEHDGCPSGATLRVEMLTPCDLDLVHRWETT
jgi:hypothetical protein